MNQVTPQEPPASFIKIHRMANGLIGFDFAGYDTDLLGMIEFARMIMGKRMHGDIHQALMNRGIQMDLIAKPGDFSPPPSVL